MRVLKQSSINTHLTRKFFSKLYRKKILQDLPTKNEDICQWYLGLLLRSETLDYSQVHGCHILRPWGMSMWLNLKQFVNSELKNSCKINESLPLEVSFPMLIPEEALGLEAEHVAGFAPEVAWVTQTGSNLDVTEGFLKKSLKANDLCKLKENSSKIQKSNDDFLDGKSKEVGETSDKVLTGTRRLAIRPTSETLFYPAYAQWIKSTRDLPMRLFQWCSVLRWERRHPIPLLRSREFHWIEGHSAFSSREMALDEAKIIVSIFKLTYENLLAVPVVLGEKSTGERFAGSEMSLTLEAAIPRSGRAIQAATAHYLGQRFAKIFGISYHDCTQLPPTQYVWQACWGLTVRALGVTIMMHGDDDGLVLPPKIAPIQVVIVPISSKIHRLKIKQLCDHLYSRIDQAGIRVLLENDDSTSTGSKFNHWELRGVPLMIIVGPDELSDYGSEINPSKDSNGSSTLRPNTSHQRFIPYKQRFERKEGKIIFDNSIGTSIKILLNKIHEEMFAKAQKNAQNATSIALTIEEFTRAHADKDISMIKSPWCNENDCEKNLRDKVDDRTKVLCIVEETLEHKVACFACGRDAVTWAFFGRTF